MYSFTQKIRFTLQALPYPWELLGAVRPGLYLLHTRRGVRFWCRGRTNDYQEVIISASGTEHPFSLLQKLRPETLVDIGAHIGTVALTLKHLLPACRMVCYEPYPANVELLSKNLAENGLSGITIIPQGIGLQSLGTRDQFLKAEFGPDSAQISAQPTSVKAKFVPLSWGLRHFAAIDLVSIDIEGLERPLFKKYAALFRRKCRYIMTELHCPKDETSVVLQPLIRQNFKIIWQKTDAGSSVFLLA